MDSRTSIVPSTPAFDLRTSKTSAANTTDMGISCPSRMGSILGGIFAEQPVYSCTLPSYDLVELHEPLEAYHHATGLWKNVKKYILFAPLVVSAINNQIEAKTHWLRQTPSRAVAEILHLSPGPEHATAIVYNYVMTDKVLRIKRLYRDCYQGTWLNRLIVWYMSKHVVLSNRSKKIRVAGEFWCYRDESDQLVVCMNDSSGSYAPKSERLPAAAMLLEGFFGTTIRIFPRENSTCD